MSGILGTQTATRPAHFPTKKKLSLEPMSDVDMIVANTQHYLDYFLGRLSTETEAGDIRQRGSRHAKTAAKSRKTGKKL
jgi:hypothetical protein